MPASGNGGALSTFGGRVVIIERSNFTGNSAPTGLALSVSSIGDLRVTDTTIAPAVEGALLTTSAVRCRVGTCSVGERVGWSIQHLGPAIVLQNTHLKHPTVIPCILA